MPTWFWEQVVLAGLLGACIADQWSHDAGAVRLILVSLWSGWAMAAQKVRSMADRQREQNELRDVEPAQLRCQAYVARWAGIAQVLGVLAGVAAAPRWPQALVALYVGLYTAVWRPLYRHWRPPKPDT